MRYENNYSELAGSSNYSDLIFFLSTTTKTEREGRVESEGLQMVSDNNNWYLGTIGKGGMNIENSRFLS